MRKAELIVPTEVMTEFVEEMSERQLDNTITGVNDDGEVIVEIIYEPDETGSVDQLENILVGLKDKIEDGD